MEQIEELEKAADTLRNEMALPEIYSDGMKVKGLQEKLKENENRHHQLTEEWESILMEKEELEEEVRE